MKLSFSANNVVATSTSYADIEVEITVGIWMNIHLL
jgi:hypothetical protein